MKKISTAALVLLCATAASAAFLTFSTPAGATLDGLSIQATVTTETAANQLFVSVTGLTQDPRSIIQGMSDILLSLPVELIGVDITGEGRFIDVASNGTYVVVGDGATGWLLDGTGLRLCVLCAGAAGPEQLIIGMPAAGGVYANANSSIAGNNPHNPFLQAGAVPVVFIISVPGMTADMAARVVSTSWGTTEGRDVPMGVVPEPGTYAIVGAGLFVLGLFGRRRRDKS